MDAMPPSTRVKKVLEWNMEKRCFEMESTHIDELRINNIVNEEDWE